MFTIGVVSFLLKVDYGSRAVLERLERRGIEGREWALSIYLRRGEHRLLMRGCLEGASFFF